MTGTVPPQLADRLAQECRASASSLLRLQDTLGAELPAHHISARLVEDLQTLDTIAQTMDDLAAVFGAIAASGDGGKPDATDDVLLASISQVSLRKRLTGNADTRPEQGVDLF